MVLFDSIYVIALAAWTGSALFLSLGAIPLVSKHLGAEPGEKLVGALLGRYGDWGAICGAIALTSIVAVPLCYPEYRGAKVAVQALAIIACLLTTLYVGNSQKAAMNVRGESTASRDGRSTPLYRRAFWLNLLVPITGVGLLAAFAIRPAPRTSGIVELTPEERDRYDRAIGRVMEQIEIKYGFRQPSLGKPSKPSGAEPTIDAETVEEIDAFYAEKRRKEDARAQRGAAARSNRGNGAPSSFPSPPS
jgi:hypothetical protein